MRRRMVLTLVVCSMMTAQALAQESVNLDPSFAPVSNGPGDFASINTGYPANTSDVKFFTFPKPLNNAKKATISEDTAILKHLIAKGMPARSERSFLGVSVAQQFGKSNAVYVSGSGLILFYNVNFVVAPMDERSNQDQAEAESISEWDQAKLALQSGGAGRMKVQRNFGGVPVASAYDESLVSQLKRAIRKALGHAGNFRDLGVRESITVYVYGPSQRIDNKINRSVLAARVQMDDLGSNKEPSDVQVIELVQYIESMQNVYSIGNLRGMDLTPTELNPSLNLNEIPGPDR